MAWGGEIGNTFQMWLKGTEDSFRWQQNKSSTTHKVEKRTLVVKTGKHYSRWMMDNVDILKVIFVSFFVFKSLPEVSVLKVSMT